MAESTAGKPSALSGSGNSREDAAKPAATAKAAQESPTPLPYSILSSYFVSNKYVASGKISTVTVSDFGTFDAMFGFARVMGPKKEQPVINEEFFKGHDILARIVETNAPEEYTVQSVVLDPGKKLVTVTFSLAAEPLESTATFRCPLLVVVPKLHPATRIEFKLAPRAK